MTESQSPSDRPTTGREAVEQAIADVLMRHEPYGEGCAECDWNRAIGALSAGHLAAAGGSRLFDTSPPLVMLAEEPWLRMLVIRVRHDHDYPIGLGCLPGCGGCAVLAALPDYLRPEEPTDG